MFLGQSIIVTFIHYVHNHMDLSYKIILKAYSRNETYIMSFLERQLHHILFAPSVVFRSNPYRGC